MCTKKRLEQLCPQMPPLPSRAFTQARHKLPNVLLSYLKALYLSRNNTQYMGGTTAVLHCLDQHFHIADASVKKC